jgi:lipoprotein-releasing system ATP-binding protein
MSETTLALEARGLAKGYRDGARRIEVLRGLDLAVPAGASLAVLGASGSGKSTLLHLLGGLDRPDRGLVLVEGRDVGALGARARLLFRNRRLGFVYQFHHLIAELSALDNVALPLILGGRSWRAARAEARALLERVGLGDRAPHRPSMLSGGERQRVAVARALVARPALVLADEPTGNLDPETGGEVVRLLCELPRDRGAALVVATHDPHLARVLDRRLVLRDGRLAEEGTPEPGPL